MSFSDCDLSSTQEVYVRTSPVVPGVYDDELFSNTAQNFTPRRDGELSSPDYDDIPELVDDTDSSDFEDPNSDLSDDEKEDVNTDKIEKQNKN